MSTLMNLVEKWRTCPDFALSEMGKCAYRQRCKCADELEAALRAAETGQGKCDTCQFWTQEGISDFVKRELRIGRCRGVNITTTFATDGQDHVMTDVNFGCALHRPTPPRAQPTTTGESGS